MHEVTHTHIHTGSDCYSTLWWLKQQAVGLKFVLGWLQQVNNTRVPLDPSECAQKREARRRREARGGGRICGQRNQQKERERQKHREYKSSVQTPNRGSKTAGMKEALKWEEQRKRKGGNDGLEKKQQSTCTIVGAENMRKREAHKFRSFQQSRHLA